MKTINLTDDQFDTLFESLLIIKLSRLSMLQLTTMIQRY